MSFIRLAGIVVVASVAMSCQQIPKEMSVVEYCSNPDHLNKDVCKVNVEVDGQKRALAQTNMSLTQARSVADEALRLANGAQQTADRALQTAEKAIAEAPMQCETKTINRTKVGSCSPGYKLVSCTQTRFTKRAGGMSILRGISDTECRYQDQVLEIQARCCMSGGATPVPQPVSTTPEAQPVTPPSPNPAS